MNDETDKLRRQLEAATAPGGVPDEALDAETASLQQGWLALGRLLEATEGPLPEPGLGWRMPAPQGRRRWRPAMLAVLAAAASLLVAAGLVWSLRATKPAVAPRVAPQQIAVRKPTPPQDAPRDTAHLARQKQVPTEAPELKWDDSLDEQLVSAGRQLVRVQEGWYAQGGGIDYVRHGLNQVEQEFNDDSL